MYELVNFEDSRRLNILAMFILIFFLKEIVMPKDGRENLGVWDKIRNKTLMIIGKQ
jgi:hypothetical protein